MLGILSEWDLDQSWSVDGARSGSSPPPPAYVRRLSMTHPTEVRRDAQLAQSEAASDLASPHKSLPHVKGRRPGPIGSAMNLAVLENLEVQKIRPLPKVPIHPTTSPRPLPQRSASSGSSVAPSRAKARRFYIANPCNTPLSPAFHNGSFPQSLRNVPHMHITPATPLPPLTPRFAETDLSPSLLRPRSASLSLETKAEFIQTSIPQSPMLNSSMFDANRESPFFDVANRMRTSKHHRRFGGSVGLVPPDVLAELRCLGGGDAHSRVVEKVDANVDSDVDSDSESVLSDEDFDDQHYSWVMAKATRVVPLDRFSLKWVQDLGGERWMGGGYSNVLRAL